MRVWAGSMEIFRDHIYMRGEHLWNRALRGCRMEDLASRVCAA